MSRPPAKQKVPTGRKTTYKIITGAAYQCEEELNSYKSTDKLAKIITMIANHKLTTILVELYK